MGLGLGFLVPYLWVLDKRVQDEFGRLTWQVPTRVYAQPLELRPGLPMTVEALEEELAAAKSKEKRRKQKAARKVKSVQETVLQDNKQFSNWTI